MTQKNEAGSPALDPETEEPKASRLQVEEVARTVVAAGVDDPHSLSGSDSGSGITGSGSGVRARSLLPDQIKVQEDSTYDLRGQVGVGGMGAVFRARDRMLHRTVALKVMHPATAQKESLLHRFYKEAQIAAQLEHPGVVPTYGLEFTPEGVPRLAMRLIRGRNLEEVIVAAAAECPAHQEPPERLFDRLELFVRACDAVHFAHERGVVHRDLKPENIMVGPHRDAYVMDWGLATVKSNPPGDPEAEGAQTEDGTLPAEHEADAVKVDGDLKATVFGEMMGTVAYMPPEQARGELGLVGPASDQFSMGMTLQEIVTLSDARQAENFTAGVTHAIMGTKVPVPAYVDPGLRAIIDKATEPEPADRYPDMQVFTEDIRRYLRNEELSVRPDPFAKKLWKRLSRHQTLALVGLLVLVLLSSTVIVRSVMAGARREREQAQAERRLSELQGKVAARAGSIDARARGVETELARLVGSLQQALLHPRPVPGKAVTPEMMRAGEGPRDTKFIERYGQKISFERPVFARAPNAKSAEADRDEARLLVLEANFQAAFESGAFVKGTRKEAGAAPLQWIYAGTPAGVLINYPGGSGLMPDYDPRTRPWYVTTTGTKGPNWGGPYGDASGSGTLLPCNRAVYGPEGELLAIAGIDFRLTDIEAEVPLRELPGYEMSWLLNEQGEVVVEARERALAGADRQDLGQRSLKKFEPAGVLSAIEKERASGQYTKGRLRYFYAGIPSLEWTYVVGMRRSGK